jgi:hypothetical protein
MTSATPDHTHAHLDLPDAVRRYQDAHDRHDTDVALSAFTADATVVDDGRTMRGTGQIRDWLANVAREFTFTRTFVGAESSGVQDRGAETSGSGIWVVHNRLEGDFPGGVADLSYRFTVSGDLISELVIAP